jgi:hypothetical protein
MALDLRKEYPGQIVTDSNYPYGRPKNESTPGANDGTPMEERWMSDLHGFLQALLLNSGTTPSDTPDSTISSQYYDAIKWLILDILQHMTAGRELAIYNGGLFSLGSSVAGLLKSGSSLTAQSGSSVTFSYGSSVTFGPSVYPVISAQVAREPFGIWIPHDEGYGAWSRLYGIYAAATADQSLLHLLERIESGASLGAVSVYVRGPTGQTVAAEHPLHCKLHRYNMTTDVATLIAEANDPYGYGTNYFAPHPISFSSLSETFTSAERLRIEISSPYGDDAVAGVRVLGASLLLNFTSMRPV